MAKVKTKLSHEAKDALYRRIKVIIEEKQKENYQEQLKLFKKDPLFKKVTEIRKKLQPLIVQQEKLRGELYETEEQIQKKYENIWLRAFNEPEFKYSCKSREIEDEIILCSEFGEGTAEDLINSIVEKLTK